MARDGVWDYVAGAFLVVGGLNWGLVGVFDYNLVDALTGNAAWVARTVYTLVGISAVYALLGAAFR
jgi:uncharacterized membrane protein YuzA (DUF378 family)